MADSPPPPPGFTLDSQAPPPPPPGFKLDGGAPPPPPGFKIDQPEDSGILSHIESAAALPFKAAAQGVKNIYSEMMKEGVQNAQDIKGDLTSPVQGKPKQGVGAYVSKDIRSRGSEKPGIADYAARAGKTALDVAQRPAIVPFAAARETLGNAGHEASGGYYDPDVIANMALLAEPMAESNLLKSGTSAIERGGRKILGLPEKAPKPLGEPPPPPPGFKIDSAAMPKEGPLAQPPALTQPRKFEDQLFQLEENRVADKAELMKRVEAAPKVAPETWEKLYHHEENPDGVKLSPEEKQIYDQHIAPLKTESDKLFRELEATTGEKFPEDETSKGYTPRYVKGKTRSIPEMLDDWKKGVESKFQGGAAARSMRKTVDAQKARRFQMAESPDGEKVIVHIGRDGKISAFDGSDDPAGPEFSDFQKGQKIGEGAKLRAEGQTWRLTKEPTSKEIEDVAATRYHKNVFANRLDNLAKLRSAVRNAKFIESMKASPEWDNVAAKISENPKEAPTTNGKQWIRPNVPQFSQYYMEPDLAHALDDARGRQHDLDGISTGIDKMGNLVKGAIFYNPIPHMRNEANHYFVEKGLVGNVRDLATGSTFRSLLRAGRGVMTQNEDFMRSLRAGASLPYARTVTADMHKGLTAKLGEAVAKDPKSWGQIAKIAGYDTPINMIKAVYKTSNKALWMMGDTFRLARHLELMEKGIPLEKAIKMTEEHMPNYRIPGKVLNQRWLSQVLQNPLATMFGRYDYNRLASYLNMAKDMVSRSNTIKDKAAAMDKLAALGFTLFVYYPIEKKIWQKITGNQNADVQRPGASAIPQAAMDVASGKRSPQSALQSTFAPGILSKPFELAQGRYMYNGQPIARWDNLTDGHPDQFARDVADWVGSSISPLGEAQRVSEGKQTLEQFVLSQIGVQTPTDESVAAKQKYGNRDKNADRRRAVKLENQRQ